MYVTVFDIKNMIIYENVSPMQHVNAYIYI